MTTPHYEIFALRYATNGERKRRENFIFTDAHDAPMPIDYYVWAIRGEGRVIVLDTGFDPATAARRARPLTRSPAAALAEIGIAADQVETVVLSHMHYDHAGNFGLFPKARFHIQDAEMAYCTGRCMCHQVLRMPMEFDHVVDALRHVYSGRMEFHDGNGTIAPGVTVHLIGGHSGGLQVVRVPTQRGMVVLAADATHFWENIRGRSPFPILADLTRMMEGYRTVEALADGPDHIIPGHDPLVLRRFPAVPGTTDTVRLDLPPIA